MEAGRVRDVQHPLVLIRRPIGCLEQGPDEVEEVGRAPALLLRVWLRVSGVVHQVLLSVGEPSQPMLTAGERQPATGDGDSRDTVAISPGRSVTAVPSTAATIDSSDRAFHSRT